MPSIIAKCRLLVISFRMSERPPPEFQKQQRRAVEGDKALSTLKDQGLSSLIRFCFHKFLGQVRSSLVIKYVSVPVLRRKPSDAFMHPVRAGTAVENGPMSLERRAMLIPLVGVRLRRSNVRFMFPSRQISGWNNVASAVPLISCNSTHPGGPRSDPLPRKACLEPIPRSVRTISNNRIAF